MLYALLFVVFAGKMFPERAQVTVRPSFSPPLSEIVRIPKAETASGLFPS